MASLVKVTRMFFDRKAVIDSMDRATRQALSKAGAFVRTRARTSMKSRKALANPGNPPSVHEGGVKRLLFFSYDPTKKSVVVGPVPYRQGKAPNLLEFGGVTTITSKSGKTKTATYDKFPFMGPALQKEISAGTIPQRWQGEVKGN